MKRKLIVLVGLLALAATPAFSDWRFDIGIDAIFGAGAISGDDIETGGFGENVLTLPMGGVGYEWQAGPVSIGVGMRGVTVIVFTILWPDVVAEMKFGPLVVEGHVGGLLFTGFGIGGGFMETGQVFIPELSVWFQPKKMFRVGAGAVGLFVPEITDEAAVFLYYLGVKWVIRPSN